MPLVTLRKLLLHNESPLSWKHLWFRSGQITPVTAWKKESCCLQFLWNTTTSPFHYKLPKAGYLGMPKRCWETPQHLFPKISHSLTVSQWTVNWLGIPQAHWETGESVKCGLLALYHWYYDLPNRLLTQRHIFIWSSLLKLPARK